MMYIHHTFMLPWCFHFLSCPMSLFWETSHPPALCVNTFHARCKERKVGHGLMDHTVVKTCWPVFCCFCVCVVQSDWKEKKNRRDRCGAQSERELIDLWNRSRCWAERVFFISLPWNITWCPDISSASTLKNSQVILILLKKVVSFTSLLVTGAFTDWHYFSSLQPYKVTSAYAHATVSEIKATSWLQPSFMQNSQGKLMQCWTLVAILSNWNWHCKHFFHQWFHQVDSMFILVLKYHEISICNKNKNESKGWWQKFAWENLFSFF